eukprot:2119656-Ditylum_brightwellii.AAC.1
MVCFFGILLRINMDPRRINGYITYFQDDPFLNLGHGYHVGLRPWLQFLCKRSYVTGSLSPDMLSILSRIL